MEETILGKTIPLGGYILQNKLQISKFALVFTALGLKGVFILNQNMA